MRRNKSDIIFDSCSYVFLTIVMLIMIYPLYFTVIASFSDPFNVATGKVTFWIKDFTLDAYKNAFNNESIWIGYRNSFIYTVLGTMLNLSLTLPAAYVLSKQYLPGRTMLSWYILFTMYFGGGLIPTYLLVKNLDLINKPYTLIVLGGFSVYNMIISRIYFQSSIQEEIYEAATIDGASHFRQFFNIALPLAKPVIAVITLYYAVGRWNDYYTALLYLSKSDYMPLQIILRQILLQNATAINMVSAQQSILSSEELSDIAKRAYSAEGMKYSLIFITSAPLLAAYPFVQKYFVKGVMIGSLKG